MKLNIVLLLLLGIVDQSEAIPIQPKINTLAGVAVKAKV
jgi:hypothetical protein